MELRFSDDGEARLLSAHCAVDPAPSATRPAKLRPRPWSPRPEAAHAHSLNGCNHRRRRDQGGYYGGRLAQHGFPVHFLLRSDFEHVRLHGLNVQSIKGNFHLTPTQLHIHNDPRRMPPVDLVIVTLKSTVADSYESLIRPLLQSDTAILTLQNGLGNEDALGKKFGIERVGGLASVSRRPPRLPAH